MVFDWWIVDFLQSGASQPALQILASCSKTSTIGNAHLEVNSARREPGHMLKHEHEANPLSFCAQN